MYRGWKINTSSDCKTSMEVTRETYEVNIKCSSKIVNGNENFCVEQE